jgi:hypothetical protein
MMLLTMSLMTMRLNVKIYEIYGPLSQTIIYKHQKTLDFLAKLCYTRFCVSTKIAMMTSLTQTEIYSYASRSTPIDLNATTD